MRSVKHNVITVLHPTDVHYLMVLWGMFHGSGAVNTELGAASRKVYTQRIDSERSVE